MSNETTRSSPALRRIFLDNPGTFGGYPDACVASGLVFTSGARSQQSGSGFESLSGNALEKQQGYPIVDHYEGLVSASAWGAHQHLEKILTAAGSNNGQILRQHVWQKDKRFFPSYERMRMAWQPTPSPSSGLGVAHIPGGGRDWIGLDAIAAAPGMHALFGQREVIAALDQIQLPSASHYSQAVRSGPLVFTAGHIPIRTTAPGKPVVQSYDDLPEEGRLLATGRSHPDSRDGPIAAQSWYVYSELRALLARASLSLDDVMLSTVYLADLKDFPVFHRVHRQFFNTHEPALAVSGFNEVGHRGCRIEIELTVLDPAYGLSPRRVSWRGTPPFAAPAAVSVGPFTFFSGMLGHTSEAVIVRSHEHLPTFIQRRIAGLEKLERRRGVAAQSFAALSRLAEAAEDAGASLAHLVKMTVYLEHEADLAVFEAVRALLMPDDALPAVEFVVVHGPGPVPHALVQVEAIAAM